MNRDEERAPKDFGPTTAETNRPSTGADHEDLDHARGDSDGAKAERKPWYKCIGPGLITGAADDDPSGIGTYSASGAAFGYGQLWLVPFCIPMMIAVQEMCGRLALITGRGVAALIKEHYPRWLLYSCVALLVLANIANVYADLNVMAASSKMLVGLPLWVWLVIWTALIAGLQIFVPYRSYSRVLKWLCLALVSYVVVALLPGMKHDWGQIARHTFVPDISLDMKYMLTAVAFLGTTISPYLFFWQAGETVEEIVADGSADSPGKRKQKVRGAEIRNMRNDTATGMIASQMVAFFIIVATAGTLHATGKTEVNTAQDAAMALKPLGPAAYWLFSLGMIGTGLLAIPTLAGSAAYAVSETAGWRYGLYRRFARAKGFYLTVAAVVIIGCLLNFITVISPVKALVYSAVLNGIVAVPLMIVLMLLCNNEKIVGQRKNGIWSNVLGWASVVVMGAAAAFFLWGLATGKAS